VVGIVVVVKDSGYYFETWLGDPLLDNFDGEAVQRLGWICLVYVWEVVDWGRGEEDIFHGERGARLFPVAGLGDLVCKLSRAEDDSGCDFVLWRVHGTAEVVGVLWVGGFSPSFKEWGVRLPRVRHAFSVWGPVRLVGAVSGLYVVRLGRLLTLCVISGGARDLLRAFWYFLRCLALQLTAWENRPWWW